MLHTTSRQRRYILALSLPAVTTVEYRNNPARTPRKGRFCCGIERHLINLRWCSVDCQRKSRANGRDSFARRA